MGDIGIEWFIVIAVGVILILAYIGLVITTLLIMKSFKKKMDNCISSIKIDLFQMRESLIKIVDYFNKYIDEEKTKELKEKLTKYDYKNLKKDEFFMVFSEFEVIKKQIEGIYINNFESTNDENINLLLSSFKDISIHYIDMTQDYNSNAVGYNYWRNLFFTKWIKKLFKINEIENIK